MFFLCNKRKTAIKRTIQQSSAPSKALLENFKIANHNSLILNPENYGIPHRHRLLGKTTKQPLSNFDPQKP